MRKYWKDLEFWFSWYFPDAFNRYVWVIFRTYIYVSINTVYTSFSTFCSIYSFSLHLKTSKTFQQLIDEETMPHNEFQLHFTLDGKTWNALIQFYFVQRNLLQWKQQHLIYVVYAKFMFERNFKEWGRNIRENSI